MVLTIPCRNRTCIAVTCSYRQGNPCLPKSLITVPEYTGLPVTGTPSISFQFYFIINRWTIYIITSCLIDRWHAIYKCLFSFDFHMDWVTCFKLGSLISPAVSWTLGDIFVYALPKRQPNLPKMPEKGSFLLHSLSQRRYIYRWRSIY